MRLSSLLTIMDKPKHDQVALRRAVELQKLTHARIDAVSFCWQPMAEADDVFDLEQRRAIKKEILRSRKAWQHERLAEFDVMRTDVTMKSVWSDDIAGWTTTTAAEKHYDLVLKSVHYSRTLIHTPLDWQLLRECPAPLLLTAARKRKPTGNVLAALDLRNPDRTHQRLNKKVLAAARTFADLTGAKIHCVYVVEISQVLRDLDIISARDMRKKAINEKQEALRDLLEGYDVPKSRIHFPVGKVGQATQALANKVRADLLVMGTSAHRVKQTIGIGNSAERVLSRVPCDVLAIHG